MSTGTYDGAGDVPVLPDRSEDERGIGWGESHGGPDDDAETSRLLDERPPHHLDPAD